MLNLELRLKIAEEAIAWADANKREHSKDERVPKRESNVLDRVEQSNRLQNIRRMTAELHETEQ